MYSATKKFRKLTPGTLGKDIESGKLPPGTLGKDIGTVTGVYKNLKPTPGLFGGISRIFCATAKISGTGRI